MTYILYLTDTTTGVKRKVAEEEQWLESESATEFLWTEGNLCCDCNRYLYYIRSINADDGSHYSCGDERFYLTVQDEQGNIIYNELD